MSKVTFNRGGTPDERDRIVARTKEIADGLKKISGSDYVRIKHIADYLDINPRSVYSLMHAYKRLNLPAVDHACGTKAYQAEKAAQRLAEREVLGG